MNFDNNKSSAFTEKEVGHDLFPGAECQDVSILHLLPWTSPFCILASAGVQHLPVG
jgi:hypothetical protein